MLIKATHTGETSATADDVAAYILERRGPMSAMKLQKLVYYCQAWSLVWDEAPLFNEKIEAWANGPVVRQLWEHHRGLITLAPPWKPGNVAKLTQSQRETVDAVLSYYGDKSAQWLSDLTHAERPWASARKGLGPGDRGSSEIALDEMADYYSGIAASAEQVEEA
jgi:uncharacterized phage-associated protein